MLHEWALQRCIRQAAVEGQDLSCTFLAHHELESVKLSVYIIVIVVIIMLPK